MSSEKAIKVNRIRQMANGFGRRMDDDALDSYLDSVEDFSSQAVKMACEDFEADTMRERMPVPIVFKRTCKKKQDWLNSQIPDSPGLLKCNYHSQGESELSRQLCREVTKDDVHYCAINGWLPMCNWHQACMQAKAFPESMSAHFVKHMLRFQKKKSEWTHGEMEFYYSTMGFYPLRPKGTPNDGPGMPQKTKRTRQINEIVKNIYKDGG